MIGSLVRAPRAVCHLRRRYVCWTICFVRRFEALTLRGECIGPRLGCVAHCCTYLRSRAKGTPRHRSKGMCVPARLTSRRRSLAPASWRPPVSQKCGAPACAAAGSVVCQKRTLFHLSLLFCQRRPFRHGELSSPDVTRIHKRVCVRCAATSCTNAKHSFRFVTERGAVTASIAGIVCHVALRGRWRSISVACVPFALWKRYMV